MRHDDIDTLRTGAAWRLLRADTAPMVISFLATVFVEENVRGIAESDLVSRLDDHLYALNSAAREAGEPLPYPRSPQSYIDQWAHPESGWLRAWYPQGSAEPHYDATPAVEQAARWVSGVRERSFVGTESRLNTVFDLLRQLVAGTREDPAERLTALRERRREIDAQIAAVESGDLSMLDDVAQRDRYQQVVQTAGDLLADLREVEANFRALDRRLRERITGWDGAKGDLLDEVVAARTAIADSDQGRSFHAFYDFLLDGRRREEFAGLVAQVQQLEALAPDIAVGDRLRRAHYDWLDAGERTQSTVRSLSEQLRRFLDDQVWLENRRVMDILRSIEARAVALRQDDQAPGALLDDLSANVVLPMERPLFTPRGAIALDLEGVLPGEEDFDIDALFEQVYVDPEKLAAAVRSAMGRRAQVGLTEVLADSPLDQGLAELMGYLVMDDPRLRVVFDDEAEQEVDWWSTEIAGAGAEPEEAELEGTEPEEAEPEGTDIPGASGTAASPGSPAPVHRVAHLPRVTFTRAASAAPAPAPSKPARAKNAAVSRVRAWPAKGEEE